MEGGSSGKKKGGPRSQENDFAQLIFSWSLEDIHNENLYQVEKIPLTFQSDRQYFRSFVNPLLEETRTELADSMKMMYKAPFAEISSIWEAKGKEKLMYDVTVGTWRNSERRKEPYRTLPGDLLLLANREPGSVSDLQSVGSTWSFLLVNYTEDEGSGNDGTSVPFKVMASQKLEFDDEMFVVFLMNVTTQKRIWNSLHNHPNRDIIKEILYPDSVVKEKCDVCSLGYNDSIKSFDPNLVSKLNESQKMAIMASISQMECGHKSSVGQIWGPPGTGKTMTVSVMLSIFLQLKCRTLTCAPTNVAIVAVASRVLSLVKESFTTRIKSGDSFCSIGDVLLFGNRERLKVGTDIEEIYLDHRIEKLTECLTGWRHCIKSMIDLLEDCCSQYHVYVENEKFKEKEITNENKSKTNNLKVKSFLVFLRERFNSSAVSLRKCIVTFCTHIPKSFLKQENFDAMVSLLDNLRSLELLLFQKNLVSEELESIFDSKPLEDDDHSIRSGHLSSIKSIRIKSLSLLKTLQTSLGVLKLPGGSRQAITRFCYERASLIFCTTSTSYTLQKVKMEPLKLLVIDEAAQMKECEAIIPLQIPGMRHAILIGDECQLPATVKSNVSSECSLGRSLFERLSSLGHSKHLLNVQYRMHPKISSFPNSKFYHNQILDAENVTCKSYGRKYLPGSMFGSYSFINIVGGREEGDDVGSKRNMVEVSIVVKIVQKLYQAWHQSKKKVSIGIVSPYTAQVVSIEEKLRYKYERCDGFSVTVKSIDGFQGGEEDIIILSTVRSNHKGSVGFMSSPQRTNVALTRARHCLWILGNERTLASSDSIWKNLVFDARNRQCLFNADANKCLKKIIIDAKNELQPLNDMVKGNSLLLKHVKWKVLFSDNFRKSFGNLVDSRMKNLVIDLLQKLSGGWRPNDGNIDCKTSSKVLKTYKVEGLHVIWTTDIIKEFNDIQVLKVWDILPLKEIPILRKELDNMFATYSNDYMNSCTTKYVEGNLEIPMSWAASQKVIQFRNVSNCEGDNEVSESLLNMKFYSLSPGMVNHLRSGREIDLPMELSDEQMDAFLCSKSSFIIGRIGTGKTSILTMKLLQNEQSFRSASKGFCEAESSRVREGKAVDDHEESQPAFLRQLFVTVNPKSCYVVKQRVSRLTSVTSDGNSSRKINLDDTDVTSDSDVPDTFVDIPEKSYPLVITFHKFLMMLDGTLGNSFFERFHEARQVSDGNTISSRSVALQTFIRSRNVTFDRFCSLYWPHFDSNLTKKLDPSRVFTEIISHIKGGLHVGEISLLSEGHAPTLTKQKRETVNTLFQAYEKMKTERGEFDLGDLVNDLHHRLKNNPYEGDEMDFIYIDEVQDLSMRQISLFKYICPNVENGFNFAGDTAQNIARGIDSRLEDTRSMLYTEFSGTQTGKQEKVNLSDIFQMKQNSRTHAGVLKLAQSVIDILYCYFSHSIDILEPESTLFYGEAPVLLKSGNDKNPIKKIFGGAGTSKEIAGFGAEQVILVRDSYSKTEVSKYVGKHALVLTIAECKGLEFQDVLLYNFFGSSPLKDEWSVIYGYMKEQDLLNEELPHSFPSFKESRHNALCSELKQLYVAITRTRQRLWIFENKEELSKPMFDYWKGRCLVKVRQLNDSVARAMRRASSPQEWLERGKKLFDEKVYMMAIMCFERAGDLTWKTLAMAFELKKSADQMRGAAEMFESVGKVELAATCYSDMGEHERAGKIYLDKCGRIEAAAECFMLARCYSEAAEAYAKGDMFSNCLLVCKKGELFDKGLQYVEYWKEHVHIRSKEMEQVEQDFLESCAFSYYERKDHKSMMKFVKAFSSMESKRVFLRSLGCFEDLLLLEEESSHFLDAAELAGSWGDVLKEASLLEMASRFKEATLLILWYVFTNSLWCNGNSGWPLMHFAQKNELCKKAKSLAKMGSNNLHAFVCSEIEVLSKCPIILSKLKKQLHNSQQHKSLRGELLSIRKILDAHLQTNMLKYDWEDELPIDSNNHVEDKISHNRVSIRTLVFYFNLWKDNVMDIFKSLGSLDNAEPNEHEAYVDFSLNYFGVRKQCLKGKIVYLIVNKDFDWVKNLGDHVSLQRDGEILTLDGKQLVLAIQSYWQSDLLSMGMKVLETLRSLYNLTLKGSDIFHQSTCLLHIFEVSKFLIDCQYLNISGYHMETLQVYLGSSMSYFDFVFPLDWRKSVSRNLIALRETDLSLKLLDEAILQNINIEGSLTYWVIGRVMMACLSSRKSVAVYKNIIRWLQRNPLWKSFFEKFWGNGFNDVYLAPFLQNALEDTFRANWSPGFMSPHSFVYLLDRLLFMASFSSGFFFTTRSSFVEWYTCTTDTMSSASNQIFSAEFLVGIVQNILYKKQETILWIERSNLVASYYHPLIALKLVMIVSLVSLQFLDCSQVLLDLLLGWNNVAYLLPQKFVGDLLQRRNGFNLNLSPEIVAGAFASVEDPLLTVHSENAIPRVHAPRAIFLDLGIPREEIMNVLFASQTTTSEQKDKSAMKTEAVLPEENHFEKISKKGKKNTFKTVYVDGQPEAIMCPKQPYRASSTRRQEVEPSLSKSDQTSVQTPEERLQNSMPMVDGMLNQFVMENHVEETGDELSNGADHSQVELEEAKNSWDDHTTLHESKNSWDDHRISHEPKNSWDDHTTLHEPKNSWDDHTISHEPKNSWDDLTTQSEANNSWDDLTQPSFASDMSCQGVESSVSTSGKRTTVQTTTEKLKSSKKLVHCFSSGSVTGQEWKVVEKVGSESSSMTEALSDKYVEETDDEHINIGQLQKELVLENQTRNKSTQDAEIKKVQGKNKGKWIRRKKGGNNVNIYEHSNDLSSVKLVLEKKTRNEITKNVEIKKGNNGKNMEKWMKKKKGRSSASTITSDEHSNENTKDVEIKKGKEKNAEKWIKNSKYSNSVNSSTSDDHSLVEFVVENQSSNYVEINKGKGKNKVEYVIKKKGSNSLNACTDNEHSNYVGSGSSNMTHPLQEENRVEEVNDDISNGDSSPLESLLEQQSSNINSQDVESKKGKGKYVAGEDATICGSNGACGDLNPPSSAFTTRIKTSDVLTCGSIMGVVAAYFIRSLTKS